MPLRRKLGRLTPEQSAKLLYDSARRRSSNPKTYREFTITYDQVLEQVKRGECPKTGVPFDMNGDIDSPFRPSLDRVDNIEGYTPDNIEVVARIYNKAKWTYSEEEIQMMAKGIVRKLSANRCEETLDLFDN